jgi:hypothetical protein
MKKFEDAGRSRYAPIILKPNEVGEEAYKLSKKLIP